MDGFISESDAAVLLAAHDVLDKIAKATSDRHWDAEPHTAFARGRAVTACEVARGAIFETLNIAAAYQHDGIAVRAVEKAIAS